MTENFPNKGIQIENKIKLSLFIEDMIVSLKYSKESTKTNS